MVSKNGTISRHADQVVKITYYNDKGEVISTDVLPPRNVYLNKTTKKEFVVVTKNNRDYRAYVEEGESDGYKCLLGSVKIPSGTNRSLFKRTSVSLDPYMVEGLNYLCDKEGMTQAEAMRCLISWGIETLEMKHGID